METQILTAPLFRLARFLERLCARVQGKGYGKKSIQQEFRSVKNLLRKDPRIAVDIGGNVGEYSAEIRRCSPDAHIHIFEPSATNVLKLNQRFADDKKIVVVPFAVSDSSGSARLYSNRPGSVLGSLTRRKLDHFNIDFNVAESVETIRFEDYWKQSLGRQRIDIVKIDVEGHELDVLKGFGDALCATDLFQFEFGGCNIDTKTYFQDFWYFFLDNNFSIYRITPIGLEKVSMYRELDEFYTTTNYIALNNALN